MCFSVKPSIHVKFPIWRSFGNDFLVTRIAIYLVLPFDSLFLVKLNFHELPKSQLKKFDMRVALRKGIALSVRFEKLPWHALSLQPSFGIAFSFLG